MTTCKKNYELKNLRSCCRVSNTRPIDCKPSMILIPHILHSLSLLDIALQVPSNIQFQVPHSIKFYNIPSDDMHFIFYSKYSVLRVARDQISKYITLYPHLEVHFWQIQSYNTLQCALNDFQNFGDVSLLTFVLSFNIFISYKSQLYVIIESDVTIYSHPDHT